MISFKIENKRKSIHEAKDQFTSFKKKLRLFVFMKFFERWKHLFMNSFTFQHYNKRKKFHINASLKYSE